jgi:hypothetical protein
MSESVLAMVVADGTGGWWVGEEEDRRWFRALGLIDLCCLVCPGPDLNDILGMRYDHDVYVLHSDITRLVCGEVGFLRGGGEQMDFLAVVRLRSVIVALL